MPRSGKLSSSSPGMPRMGTAVLLSESDTSEKDVYGPGIERTLGAEPERLL